MAASRLIAVNQPSGGSDVLLLSIAGPVIAGTSLFGGRGSVWSALLGALVIGSISNGIDLLALESDTKFMVTVPACFGIRAERFAPARASRALRRAVRCRAGRPRAGTHTPA